MYPEAKIHLTDGYCLVCHLRHQACLCDAWEHFPTIESRCRFFLLVHSRELTKPTNTGHLLLRGIDSSEYAVWSRVEPPMVLKRLLKDKSLQPYLLFPEDATDGRSEVASPESVSITASNKTKQPVFILIDSTWQEARKIYRQSTYLQQLPLMSLSSERESQYGLRRNQPHGHLSTVEVAVELLHRVGEERQSQLLSDRFQLFLRHYKASRSNHGAGPAA